MKRLVKVNSDCCGGRAANRPRNKSQSSRVSGRSCREARKHESFPNGRRILPLDKYYQIWYIAINDKVDKPSSCGKERRMRASNSLRTTDLYGFAADWRPPCRAGPLFSVALETMATESAPPPRRDACDRGASRACEAGDLSPTPARLGASLLRVGAAARGECRNRLPEALARLADRLEAETLPGSPYAPAALRSRLGPRCGSHCSPSGCPSCPPWRARRSRPTRRR